jgi:hypothetical protein
MALLLEWTMGGADVALEIDASPSQGYEATAEVTEHPVEQGAPVTDHIRPNNPTITVEGVISNTPVTVPTTQMQGARRAPTQVDLSVGGQTLQATLLRWSSAFDRVRECDQLLQHIVEAGIVVRLTTGLRVIEDLALTRYKVDKTRDTGDTLPVVLEFRRLRLVAVQRVTVPAVRRGQLLDTRGPQPTVPNNSLLYNLRNSGAGAIRNALGLSS